MKSRQIPKWTKVFGDLRSGVVHLKYKDDRTVREFTGSLINGFIPEKQQAEMSPNNPLHQESIKAYDFNLRRWVTIEIESIQEYDGIVSLTPPRNPNDRPRTDAGTETSSDQGTQEEGNARKFRSRYDPQTDQN